MSEPLELLLISLISFLSVISRVGGSEGQRSERGGGGRWTPNALALGFLITAEPRSPSPRPALAANRSLARSLARSPSHARTSAK